MCRDIAKNARHVDISYVHTFITIELRSMAALYKWIMNMDATKHITPFKCLFNTYEPSTLYCIYRRQYHSKSYRNRFNYYRHGCKV